MLSSKLSDLAAIKSDIEPFNSPNAISEILNSLTWKCSQFKCFTFSCQLIIFTYAYSVSMQVMTLECILYNLSMELGSYM